LTELQHALSKVGDKSSFLGIEREKIFGKSMKNYISFCICYLKDQKEELRIVKLKIKRRDLEFFSKCIASKLTDDSAHAKLYASECVEMRKLFKIIFQCELVLEQVIIRLETLQIFSEISYVMVVSVGSVLERIKDEISDFMPKFSYELEDITTKLDNFTSSSRIQGIEENPSELTSESAIQIFDEASVFAENEVKNSFPKLPVESIEIIGIKEFE
jgi:division protein CdvB (Snf7/Vps24/ESCRT-III family)